MMTEKSRERERLFPFRFICTARDSWRYVIVSLQPPGPATRLFFRSLQRCAYPAPCSTP